MARHMNHTKQKMNKSSFTFFGFGMSNLIQGMFFVLLIKMELKVLLILIFTSPITSIHEFVSQPSVHAVGTTVRPALMRPATAKGSPHEKPAHSETVF